MAGEELGYIIKKAEESAVQKFKNQNKLLKKFKKAGLKVYKAITKKGISGAELSEKSGVPPEELAEIISFMEKNGMVELEAGAKPPRKKEEMPAPPRFPAAGPLLPETGAGKPEAPAPPKAPPRAVPPAMQPPPPLPPRPPAAGKLPPRSRVEDEIRPISEEEFTLGAEEKAPGEELPKKGRELPPEPEEGEEIRPIEFEKERKPSAAPPKAPPRAPPEEVPPPPRAPAPPPQPEAEEEYLTPSEKAIKDRYGDVGLKVYSFIDGQRTAEQIMRETGVTEAKLIEMLDFMEKKGIIRLEHPERRRAPTPPPPRPPGMAPPAGAAPPVLGPPISGPRPPIAPKTMFSPMVEEKPELGVQISEKELAAISLDIPARATKNVLEDVQAKMSVMLKFGKEYVRAYELIDGKKDVVDLAIETKIPLYRIYGLLAFLQEKKAVVLKPALRDEIRRKYGEDGYSVYKKYGREGILLYQLIGKEMSLKEMAALTTTDPNRVIEMFMFIHKLLGIELPIDEDVLRERLGIKKPSPPA